jgi:hypothetical protein
MQTLRDNVGAVVVHTSLQHRAGKGWFLMQRLVRLFRLVPAEIARSLPKYATCTQNRQEDTVHVVEWTASITKPAQKTASPQSRSWPFALSLADTLSYIVNPRFLFLHPPYMVVKLRLRSNLDWRQSSVLVCCTSRKIKSINE